MGPKRPNPNPGRAEKIIENISNLAPNASMYDIKKALLTIPSNQRNPKLLNELVKKSILKPANIITIVNHYMSSMREIKPSEDHLAISVFMRQIVISQHSIDEFFKHLHETTFPNTNQHEAPPEPSSGSAAKLARAAVEQIDGPPANKEPKGWLARNLPRFFDRD
jgi:hypothetical protein